MSGLGLDAHLFGVCALVVVFVWCCAAATLWLWDQLSHLEDDQ